MLEADGHCMQYMKQITLNVGCGMYAKAKTIHKADALLQTILTD